MKNNKGLKTFLNPALFGGFVCFFNTFYLVMSNNLLNTHLSTFALSLQIFFDRYLKRLFLFNEGRRFFCFIPFSFFNCKELADSRLELYEKREGKFCRDVACRVSTTKIINRSKIN